MRSGVFELRPEIGPLGLRPDPMVSASPGDQAGVSGVSDTSGVSDVFLLGMVYIARVQKTYGRIARK